MLHKKNVRTRNVGMSHMSVIFHGGSRFDRNSLSNRLSDWTKTKTYTCMEILFKNMKLKLVALNIKRLKYTRTTKQNNKTCVASTWAKNPKKDNFSSEFGNESMEKELK